MARRILEKAPDTMLKLKRRHDRRGTTDDGNRDINHGVVGNDDGDDDDDDDDDNNDVEARNIRMQWEQMTSSSKKKIPPISFGPRPIKSNAKKVTVETFDSDRLLHPWHREMNKMKSEVRRQQEVQVSTDIMAEVDGIYVSHGGDPQPRTERSNSAGVTTQPSSSSSAAAAAASSSLFVSDPKQGVARKTGKKLKKLSTKDVEYSSGVILPSLEMYHPSYVTRSRSPPISAEDGIASSKAPWTIANDTSAKTRGDRSHENDTNLNRFHSMQQLQLMPLSSPMSSRPTTSQSNYSDNDNMSRPSTGSSSTSSRGHISRNGSQGVLNSPNNSFLDWGDRFGSSTTSDGGSLDLSHNSSLSSFGSPFPSPSREMGPTLRGDAISRVSNVVANNLSASTKKEKASTRISMSSFEPIPELVSGHDGDEDMDDDVKEANRQVSSIVPSSSHRKQNDAQIATNKMNTSSRTVDSSNDDGESDESDDEEIGWSPFTMVNA
jgi:hypothetical protein